VGLCIRFGHHWPLTVPDESVRRCSQCGKKQHRSPGGPWVDRRRDQAAGSRATPDGQVSLFEKGV
jgi:hypothetical protein